MRKIRKSTNTFRLILTSIMLVFCVLGLNITEAFAGDSTYYTAEKDEHTRYSNPLINITDDMNTADYWFDKTPYLSEQILANISTIKEINKSIIEAPDNNVRDFENGFDAEYDADVLSASLSGGSVPDRNFYIGETLVDNNTYFTAMKDAIANTGYNGIQTPKLAVCTNRANMKDWPTDDFMKYSIDDTDDEIQSSAMNVNEPFVIKAKCELNEKTFYWGYSLNCQGWINGENVAICDTKEEWLNNWKVNPESDDFVVVTDSRINMVKAETASVPLMLGTILKVVPDENIPESMKGLMTDNYIVYVPKRDIEGKLTKELGIISKDLNVNKGFLPFNEKNVLEVAFSCLGDKYGWGCAEGNMDCSAYVRQIYRCFGFELARNTTWQLTVPGKYTDLSSMTDDDKIKYFSTLQTGTALYFSGHTMIYLGLVDDTFYVISDLSSVYDTDGTYKAPNAVVVNSLDVKRGNGKTWLTNLHALVNLADAVDLSLCDISLDKSDFEYDGEEKKPEITVIYNNHALYENINYTVEYEDNIQAGSAKVIIKGINNFKGSASKSFEIKEAPIPEGIPYDIEDPNKRGFDSIVTAIESSASKNHEIAMNGATTVPASVFTTAKGKDTTLIFDMGNGVKWSVDGKDIVGTDLKDINLQVIKGEEAGKTIPVEVIKELAKDNKTVNLTLAYDGDFGFKAKLSLKLDENSIGQYANLFYYNPNTKNLEYSCASKIDENGNVEFTFTHASDYTIVISDSDMKITENNLVNKEESVIKPAVKAPETGDNTPIIFLIMVMISTFIVAVLCFFFYWYNSFATDDEI